MSIKLGLFKYNQAKRQITIGIKAKAGSKKNSIEEFTFLDKLAYLKISVKAIAENGKANSIIITYLSKQWKIPKVNIEIIHGLNSNYKIIAIKNIEIECFEKLLVEKLPITQI